MSIKKPCIVCGTLTDGNARCELHRLNEVNARARRRGRRLHYDGAYAKRAAYVRAHAIQCWLCGEGARAHDPWTADHVRPGDPDSPLLPAHRSCNSSRGDAGKRQQQQPKPLF